MVLTLLLLACAACSGQYSQCGNSPKQPLLDAASKIRQHDKAAATAIVAVCLQDHDGMIIEHRTELVFILLALGNVERAERIAAAIPARLRDATMTFQLCGAFESTGDARRALTCYQTIEPAGLHSSRMVSVEQSIGYDIKLKLAMLHAALGHRAEARRRAAELHEWRAWQREPALLLARELLRAGDRVAALRAIDVLEPFATELPIDAHPISYATRLRPAGPYDLRVLGNPGHRPVRLHEWRARASNRESAPDTAPVSDALLIESANGRARVIELLALARWKLGERHIACGMLAGKAPSAFSDEIICPGTPPY